jgi:hypothetical protein
LTDFTRQLLRWDDCGKHPADDKFAASSKTSTYMPRSMRLAGIWPCHAQLLNLVLPMCFPARIKPLDRLATAEYTVDFVVFSGGRDRD